MLLGLVLGAVGWAVIAQFSSLASELPGYQDNLKQDRRFAECEQRGRA